MVSPIYFCGSDVLSFGSIGAQLATTGALQIDSTAGRFRTGGYARYAISQLISQVTANTVFQVTPSLSGGSGGLTSFWWTGRVWAQNVSIGSPTTNCHLWQIRDINGIVRLRMRNTNTGVGLGVTAGPYAIETVNAAGAATQIGSTTIGGLSQAPGTPDKIDVQVVYAGSGTGLLTVWINGTQVFTFSGSLLTDSNTTVDFIFLGACSLTAAGTAPITSWSEIVVASQDTRAMSLGAQGPVAPGNTDNFTSGSAANMNQNAPSYTSPDYSATAGQLQEYEVTPAVPTGTFSIVSVVQHIIAAVGGSGPQHIQAAVRTGGADFTSSNLAPPSSWGLVTHNWDSNPNTSAAWLTTDLAASSSAFNAGYESAA